MLLTTRTLCLALILISVHAAAAAADFAIVRARQPVAAIVLPAQTEHDRYLPEKTAMLEAELREKNPGLDEAELERLRAAAVADLQRRVEATGDEELLAAEELQSILERIGGAKLEVRRVEAGQAVEGPAILLGAQLARQAGLGEELDALDEDGFIARVQGDKLILSGRRARGTLYAAYELLEELGCRWVMPGPFGELYPSLDDVVTSIDTTQNPSHRERYFWCTGGHADGYARWTLRNKGDFVRTPDDPMVAQGHALSQPLAWGASNPKYAVKTTRTVTRKVAQPDGTEKEEQVEEEVTGLPDEYYALDRGRPAHHTPNMANPRVWDLYADFYIDYFNRNPLEEYVSLSAEDGLVIDDRPESRKLDSREMDPAIGAPSATDRLWFFHNRIIERVVKVHPDKKFGVLVYSNNMTPPRLEPVHPNMALVFAPLSVAPNHHVRDERSKTNRWYREWLEDWMRLARAAGAETYYYDYEPTGYCWNMAMICPRWAIIGTNYPWFHELGLDGHTTQGHDDWAACGFDNYLMQRLYWDATLDYRAVLEDYCRARFGTAAEAMLKYYDVYERRMSDLPGDLYQNEVWDNHLILTPQVRAEARAHLERAVELADSERAREHVRTMVELQRSTDAAADAMEHADATGDFGAAAEMMQPIWEARDRLNQLYPNYMNAQRLSEAQTAEFMTGGIYNQYREFDQRIDGAKASVLLPRVWKGMLDTRPTAEAMGYHRPDADVSALDELDVTVSPDVKYGTERELAAFFYRTEADVPESFAGSKMTLFFPSVIARNLQIWINGEPVRFEHRDAEGNVVWTDTVWRGPDYFWIDYDHQQSFDVTPLLKPGQKNTIAFRVFKSYDFGGTYRRVFLLAE